MRAVVRPNVRFQLASRGSGWPICHVHTHNRVLSTFPLWVVSDLRLVGTLPRDRTGDRESARL